MKSMSKMLERRTEGDTTRLRLRRRGTGMMILEIECVGGVSGRSGQGGGNKKICEKFVSKTQTTLSQTRTASNV